VSCRANDASWQRFRMNGHSRTDACTQPTLARLCQAQTHFRRGTMIGLPPSSPRRPNRVRFRLPAADDADNKGRNAPKPDRNWPPTQDDACWEPANRGDEHAQGTFRKARKRAPRPWNKGKLIGSKPLRAKDVWSILTKLQVEERTRDSAIFNLAIYSKLRRLRCGPPED
jgi:hypothetical protein